jgi:cell division protein FtsB
LNRKRLHSSALEMHSPERETIWQTLSRITATLIFVAALGVAGTFFIPELERQEALQRDIEGLEQQHQVALETRNLLRRELRLLNDDPEYLEIKARDQLNLYKPNETILRIESVDRPVSSSPGEPSSDLRPTG